MTVLFTILTILNVAALAWMAVILMGLMGELPAIVETAIADEVRKQDDRIEKRHQRAQGPTEDTPETLVDGAARLQVGRPYTR